VHGSSEAKSVKAIIIAGGRATRLGPLTAQMNKALVSVGQRPMIVHQLELLRRVGVRSVAVVVSPESRLQVQDVVTRSHAGLTDLHITYPVQHSPNGPADAVKTGVISFDDWDDETLVIMADTFIDESLAVPGDWIGVGRAPSSRQWCFDAGEGDFVEGLATAGTDVTIGVYRFTNTKELYHAADYAIIRHRQDREAPMAALLNEYVYRVKITQPVRFDSWLDVGDVPALQAARRKRFITRDFNHLELTDDGRIIKRGVGPEFEREARFYRWLDETDVPGLLFYPRLTDYHEENGTPVMLGLEHVDMPTLAELYLYWPGTPDMWSDILSGIFTQLNRKLWKRLDLTTNWAKVQYQAKPLRRLHEAGMETPGLQELVNDLYEFIKRDYRNPVMVYGHGDLNWGNILYSLNTGALKLVDPRGDTSVDLAYEIAKVRYSYRDHFCSITHGLFETKGGVTTFGPQRAEESAAMDKVVARHFPGIPLSVITAIEATLFLSALPLHPEHQRDALLQQALHLAEEVISAPIPA
jgi:hypothetical protein